ncbi:hypothetical protein B4U79_03514 [Dinothrombium tinctorium]|uniref:Uncharacterized protein n=1 Tax=Dinothrombium tinctorium TaxID=1965070 RepID=A0A3S3NL64_9ACAR|nr:hypothetical protein B4U79_03514 [Dinothrombium tinctorium]
MPMLQMLDYKVNYENHAKFRDGKNRKLGSPKGTDIVIFVSVTSHLKINIVLTATSALLKMAECRSIALLVKDVLKIHGSIVILVDFVPFHIVINFSHIYRLGSINL